MIISCQSQQCGISEFEAFTNTYRTQIWAVHCNCLHWNVSNSLKFQEFICVENYCIKIRDSYSCHSHHNFVNSKLRFWYNASPNILKQCYLFSCSLKENNWMHIIKNVDYNILKFSHYLCWWIFLSSDNLELKLRSHFQIWDCTKRYLYPKDSVWIESECW